MDPLELLVDVLATYRLTRLATADVISEPVRRSLVGRLVGADQIPESEDGSIVTAQETVESLKDPPKLATLITCRWCAGMWIAGGVVFARQAYPKYWEPLARAMALSAAGTLLARYEDD